MDDGELSLDSGLRTSLDTVAGEFPLVQRVWSARCDAATSFVSAAKGASMMVFARHGDRMTAHLRGPETAATPLPVRRAGSSSVWSCSSVRTRPCSRRPVWPT